MDLSVTPISEAPDVNITGRTTGQVLSWNAATNKHDYITISSAAETLAQTLVAGQTTGPTSIVLSATSRIESPTADVLSMLGGTIELVADYDTTYNAGLYAGGGYAALFFDSWGGAFEGSANAGGDPRGGYANIYTPSDATTGRMIFVMSDNADGAKGLEVTGLFMVDVTNGHSAFSTISTPKNKKVGAFLVDGGSIEQNVILSVIENSKDSILDTDSAFTSIQSSNASTTRGITYGAVLASDTIDLALAGNSLSTMAIIASSNLTINNTLAVSDLAIIASATAWGELESNTLYSDNLQLAGTALIKSSAAHVDIADTAQIRVGDIIAGNAAIIARTELGDEVKLYKHVDAALANVAKSGDANTDALIEALKAVLVNIGIGASA